MSPKKMPPRRPATARLRTTPYRRRRLTVSPRLRRAAGNRVMRQNKQTRRWCDQHPWSPLHARLLRFPTRLPSRRMRQLMRSTGPPPTKSFATDSRPRPRRSPVRMMNTIWADTAGVHDDLTSPLALRQWLIAVEVCDSGKLDEPTASEVATARLLRDALPPVSAPLPRRGTDAGRRRGQSAVSSLYSPVRPGRSQWPRVERRHR